MKYFGARARRVGILAALAACCASACSTIGTIHFYEPASEGGTTLWENPLTQGSSRLSGPDNRVTLSAPGVVVELWSESWGQGRPG